MLDIQPIINEEDFQDIINSTEFYFQKGKDALQKWIALNLPDTLKDEIMLLSRDYNDLQDQALTNPQIKDVLDLFFEIISYCDSKANEKNKYNKYDDKRVLALAAVRMGHWVRHLLQYKFKPEELPQGSTKNAFNYLLYPENNSTILSENHRELIAKNLFKKDFNSSQFVDDLKTYFDKYNLKTANPQNHTLLLSRIIYSIEDQWKEEVVALMASDGTGWQEERIEEMEGYDAAVIWNSKRPSGTNETLKFLRSIIEEGKSFNLYHSSRGMVNYKATIIDFAENQQQLDEKAWDNKLKVLYYNPSFASYRDDRKSAAIVFLSSRLEEIEPIPVSDFTFYNGYDAPRQDNLSPIKLEPEKVKSIHVKSEKPETTMNSFPVTYPLNQILYGPPGTGKTYNTINKALEIIGENTKDKSRQDIKKVFENKMKEGQIVFTTFHQSMSYEDFIEGIKPVEPEKEGDPVIYRIELGIFRNLCIEASFAIAQLRESKTTEEVLDFSILYDNFAEGVEEKLLNGQKVELETKAGGSVMVESISQQGNFIIKHHEGTRTYTVSKPRLTKLHSAIKNLSDVSNINDQFREIIGGSNSSAYWSVLNAIQKEKPIRTTSKDNRNYTLEEKKEVVLSLTKDDYTNKAGKPFVLIVDEINRGNVSQIFGELITLIEDDKRLGKEEVLEVVLPYSKEKFGVPPNLYIIGTMNTADRSVEALDAALRRRFCFEEMPPRVGLIATEGNLKSSAGILGEINLVELLLIINNRIEKLLDKDHQIGHSYFISVGNLKELKGAFQNKIIPLLQEYFFGDYGKIGLVLGKGFFEPIENAEETPFADFDDYDSSQFSERPIYKIREISKMNDDDFNEAIKLLLRK